MGEGRVSVAQRAVTIEIKGDMSAPRLSAAITMLTVVERAGGTVLAGSSSVDLAPASSRAAGHERVSRRTTLTVPPLRGFKLDACSNCVVGSAKPSCERGCAPRPPNMDDRDWKKGICVASGQSEKREADRPTE